MRKISLYIAFICFGLILSPRNAWAPPQVRITGVTDINMGTWDHSSDMSGNDNLCIHDTNNTKYTLTVTDDSTLTPANFRLENVGSTAEIPYTVTWTEISSTNSFAMSDGVAQSNIDNADKNSELCAGGDVANITVDILSSDLQSVPAGTYTATIEMVVEP